LANLAEGRKIVEVADNLNFLCGGAGYSLLSISGFAADPGRDWLASITCNGIQNTGGNSGYICRDGVASWDWRKPWDLRSVGSGSNVQCVIVNASR
jgi:hypothetical protein